MQTKQVPTIAIMPDEVLSLSEKVRSGLMDYANLWKKTINNPILIHLVIKHLRWN